jgi:hypothetical protein
VGLQKPEQSLFNLFMDNQDILIEDVLKKYPSAKRVAVENFVMSAPFDIEANRENLLDDVISYGWNVDTFLAIKECLAAEDKI